VIKQAVADRRYTEAPGIQGDLRGHPDNRSFVVFVTRSRQTVTHPSSATIRDHPGNESAPGAFSGGAVGCRGYLTVILSVFEGTPATTVRIVFLPAERKSSVIV
jgi:hypothetical protein